LKQDNLISFVIPFYKNISNTTEVLNTISKFVGLSKNKFEVIFVNDSGDGSLLEIEDEFIFNLKVINLTKNLGVTGARNIGLKEAKGIYVLFFDSDDRLIPNLFDHTFNFLFLNNFDIILFRCVDELGNLIGKQELQIEKSRTPNFFYGKGECLVCVKKKSRINPFINFYRGNEHVGLLKYAIINYPIIYATSNFPIRIYTNNKSGLSSKINTPQRSILMTIAHFNSSLFSLMLLEPIYTIRFLLAGFYRLFIFIRSFLKLNK
jgi:glycosyltransferase involved in cell wall biosynthesis